MQNAVQYGAKPWQQTSWDARAASNFICGGAGSGLIIAAALSGEHGSALSVPVLLGLALIACGLTAVFAEIGRPLRAVNVIFNPRQSWMSREALVAPLVFAFGLAAVLVNEAFVYAAAACAAAFVYCQSRMLGAAKGIPAWRAPALRPLIIVTGLAEGAGLWLLVAAFVGTRSLPLLFGFVAIVVLRTIVFRRYRAALGNTIAPQAAATLARASRVLTTLGTIAPVVLVGVAIGGGLAWIGALAGVAAAAAGAYFKLRLVLGAGHNQGFALPHLPVRGVRG
jgi:phenylacetyl-CoA:acceptor oxidoreductase subunit 2